MSTTTQVTQNTPRKVIERALHLGAHLICVESDQRGACAECSIIMHEVFDHFYGHAMSAEAALDLILIDILNDRESE